VPERVHKIGGRFGWVRQAIPGDEHHKDRGSDCGDVSERPQGEVPADEAQQRSHERECAPHNPYDPRIHAGPRAGRLDGLSRKEELESPLIHQWRALATRYDKPGVTYRAAVGLSACITWTRAEESRPPAPTSRARDRPR
jgi:hypothetical protein